MSTRSNIIVEDKHNRIQLYRHWDGYPSGVLPELEIALLYAWQLPRFEAQDFAAAIVRGWKQEGGGNIYIDGSPQGWELIHGDVEWVYLIKPQKVKTKESRQPFFSGEPIVEVYDWHDYWFNKANPEQIKPRPVKHMNLSQAKRVGRKWEA